MTVNEIALAIDKIVPFATAEDYDNVGLLVGDSQARVNGILVALDLTPEVIEKAVSINADLIVTHHPIMFKGIKRVVSNDYESNLIMSLIKNNISHIAAHTNFDKYLGGINAALFEALGLYNICKPLEYITTGTLKTPLTAEEFSNYAQDKLSTVVRVYKAVPERTIKTVAFVGGSGGDFYKEVISLNPDAFLTGEIGYHEASYLRYAGISTFEAGHFATEKPGVRYLYNELSKITNGNIHLEIM